VTTASHDAAADDGEERRGEEEGGGVFVFVWRRSSLGGGVLRGREWREVNKYTGPSLVGSLPASTEHFTMS